MDDNKNVTITLPAGMAVDKTILVKRSMESEPILIIKPSSEIVEEPNLTGKMIMSEGVLMVHNGQNWIPIESNTQYLVKYIDLCGEEGIYGPFKTKKEAEECARYTNEEDMHVISILTVKIENEEKYSPPKNIAWAADGCGHLGPCEHYNPSERPKYIYTGTKLPKDDSLDALHYMKGPNTNVQDDVPPALEFSNGSSLDGKNTELEFQVGGARTICLKEKGDWAIKDLSKDCVCHTLLNGHLDGCPHKKD